MDELRLAVLIDADNAPRKSIKGIMEEIAVHGTPTYKRIYGDWTKPNMDSWKNSLLDNAITPIQQYGYTTGKNSTDSAMIIDAMDILYSGKVDGFCLVSSDSDFTRLAVRLREAGMKVIGMGEKKTPNPFIVACDRFIYIEIINERYRPAPQKSRSRKADAAKESAVVKETAPQPDLPEPQEKRVPQSILDLISVAIDDVCDDDGWAYLGEVGGLLQKKQPDFDSRSFGFKKLTLLIENCDCFEMDSRDNLQKGNGKLIYVRNRK